MYIYIYVFFFKLTLRKLALPHNLEKSRIRETKNLSTDVNSRTDTILKRLHEKN